MNNETFQADIGEFEFDAKMNKEEYEKALSRLNRRMVCEPEMKNINTGIVEKYVNQLQEELDKHKNILSDLERLIRINHDDIEPRFYKILLGVFKKNETN